MFCLLKSTVEPAHATTLNRRPLARCDHSNSPHAFFNAKCTLYCDRSLVATSDHCFHHPKHPLNLYKCDHKGRDSWLVIQVNHYVLKRESETQPLFVFKGISVGKHLPADIQGQQKMRMWLCNQQSLGLIGIQHFTIATKQGGVSRKLTINPCFLSYNGRLKKKF